MLSFLPSTVVSAVTLSVVGVNTVFHATLTMFALPLKWLGSPAIAAQSTRFSLRVIENWCGVHGWMLDNLLPDMCWQVDVPKLERQQNYFLVCNHQSWVDIFVLYHVFHRKIPLIRFFTKQQVAWIPFVGFSLLAADFPLMKRYSKELLVRKPHLRGKDIETTQRICARIVQQPHSILIFLEGTLFSPVKQQAQQSPYQHLLKPKATGMAFAMMTLGSQIDQLLDVTLHYPDGVPSFIELWSGRMRRVVVKARLRPIPPAFTQGDYEQDVVFRTQFQSWVSRIWQDKDELLTTLRQQDV